MNQHAYRKSFVVGAVAIGVIAGVAVGFFTAHRMMGDMAGMTRGTGGVSAPPGRVGEMGIGGVPGEMSLPAQARGGGVQQPPGRAGEMGSKKEGAETRQMNGLTLVLTTAPEHPKAGDVLLKLKLTDQAGKPVTNAQVLFVYTMPMPGMTDSKVPARHTKDGLYEEKVLFGMGGTWVVTVNVTIPRRPPIAETFQFSVAGGGM